MRYYENPPYYLTAYGIARKHGFRGTEDEWLESLRGERGERGPQGSGLVFMGSYDTEKALREAHPTGKLGDCYKVGAGTDCLAYYWDVEKEDWESVHVAGPPGPQGEKGETGEAGKQGPPGQKGDTGETGERGKPFTYADFTPEQLEALRGPKGDTGQDGKPGPKGDPGATGKEGPPGPVGPQGEGFTIKGYFSTLAALEAAVPAPTEGSNYGVGEAAPYDIYTWDAVHLIWVNNGTIQGAPGKEGPPGPAGADGDPGQMGPPGQDGADGPAGPAGKSAYQYAVDGGYPGTEDQFKALMGTGPWLPLSGGTMTGSLKVKAPSAPEDAASKKYVDDLVGDIETALAAI